MKYYLVKKQTYFYDPHGTPDDVPIVIEVITEKQFKIEYTNFKDIELEEGREYIKDWGAYGDTIEESEKTEFYGEDGYNCEIDYVSFKSINPEEYDLYRKIIKDYDLLISKI